MKNKYYGLSTMGYVIATFILIGVVMIFSAPMLLDSLENDEKSKASVTKDLYSELNLKVDKSNKDFDRRLEVLEQNLQNQESIFDKYICTIEGTLNAAGDVVPIDEGAERFVFVCEYKK